MWRHLGTLALTILLCGCGGDEESGADGSGAGGGAGGCALGSPIVVQDQAYTSIAGVEPSLLSLDYYSPARTSCDPLPIVIWVHGGAWAIGDKDNSMTDKVALVNGEGWLLVSVNYRLSPDTPSDDPNRVMYPDHPTDVATALAWVRSHGSEIGGDVGRIAILGHSAGAHLVALVATDESFLAAHAQSLASVRCVGSFDTEAYDIPAALASASAQQQAILENAFGTDPAVQADASPITHVAPGKGTPPFLIATRGDATRQAIQESFRQALSDAGITATMIDATGLSHEEVQDRIGAAGDTVMTPPIVAFLNGCFQ
jgi:acetyl esterase/lipase